MECVCVGRAGKAPIATNRIAKLFGVSQTVPVTASSTRNCNVACAMRGGLVPIVRKKNATWIAANTVIVRVANASVWMVGAASNVTRNSAILGAKNTDSVKTGRASVFKGGTVNIVH